MRFESRRSGAVPTIYNLKPSFSDRYTMFSDAYKGKSVLVTGHSGFKGSWLSLWLYSLGARVTGLSVGTPSDPCNFEVSELEGITQNYFIDIRDSSLVAQVVADCQPDFVFHLAAQALVRPSYASPLDTLSVNAMGSANILDAVRKLDKSVTVVMITSDKAYDNVEWAWGYRETDALGGKDPYSASKGMAELAIRSYVESFFNSKDCDVRVGIARAGNVIGGGDWGTDRIVPDCMRAWSIGDTVDIRSPNATRPWQHVLEPLSGYLSLGAELIHSRGLHGQAYNFGPPAHQNHAVSQLIEEMGIYWNNVRWNDISENEGHVHEAGLLKLNCDKALLDLSWVPTLEFERTVRMTVEWYKAFYEHEQASMREFTLGQIEQYSRVAEEQGLSWTR